MHALATAAALVVTAIVVVVILALALGAALTRGDAEGWGGDIHDACGNNPDHRGSRGKARDLTGQVRP